MRFDMYEGTHMNGLGGQRIGLIRPRRNRTQPSQANPNATKKRPPALVRNRKQAALLATVRRWKLAELIIQGVPTQREAARILGVSEKTIYRDLHVINGEWLARFGDGSDE